MSPSGTAILVATAQDAAGGLGCSNPVGIWQAIADPGHRPGPATKIAPDGRAGAITVLNPGSIPYQTLAWSVLPTAANQTATLAPIPDPKTVNSPSLAANTAGQFVIAWMHSSSDLNGIASLRAATGTGGQLGTPRLLTSRGHQPSNFTAAINARGDVIVAWNDFGPSMGRGMYAAVYRPTDT
jgi:hypothetical protein